MLLLLLGLLVLLVLSVLVLCAHGLYCDSSKQVNPHTKERKRDGFSVKVLNILIEEIHLMKLSIPLKTKQV